MKINIKIKTDIKKILPLMLFSTIWLSAQDKLYAPEISYQKFTKI